MYEYEQEVIITVADKDNYSYSGKNHKIKRHLDKVFEYIKEKGNKGWIIESKETISTNGDYRGSIVLTTQIILKKEKKSENDVLISNN